MAEKDTQQRNESLESQLHASALDDIEMVDVEETLKEYDSESVLVENRGLMAKMTTVMAILLSVFQLYLASPWGTMPQAQARAIHLGLVMGLIFLNVPHKQHLKCVHY